MLPGCDVIQQKASQEDEWVTVDGGGKRDDIVRERRMEEKKAEESGWAGGRKSDDTRSAGMSRIHRHTYSFSVRIEMSCVTYEPRRNERVREKKPYTKSRGV
jgi:hypothetical protein